VSNLQPQLIMLADETRFSENAVSTLSGKI
jgi:hypothetical protein